MCESALQTLVFSVEKVFGHSMEGIVFKAVDNIAGKPCAVKCINRRIHERHFEGIRRVYTLTKGVLIKSVRKIENSAIFHDILGAS